jgi:predicted alpha-1,2-mannosidase
MKNNILFLLLLFLAACTSKEEVRVSQYVDPFIGTAYTGHTFPGAAFPLGLMQPGPQTGNCAWEYCAGYNYEDSLIEGFTQTRLSGTGIPDLGDILIMPFSGTPRDDYKSAFSKASEKASPGYYSVYLDDNAVHVEMTSMPHTAVYRYRFEKENPSLYINFQSGNVSSREQYETRVLEAEITNEDDRTITGRLKVNHWVERQIYFIIRLSQPIVSEKRIPADARNKAPILLYQLANQENELQLTVTFSTVSVENARQNLEEDVGRHSFDEVRELNEWVWEEYLSRIRIKGTREQKTNAYTSLYHLLIQPNNLADEDGEYRGANDSVFISPAGKYYSTFSLWDTFRAAHPFYTILYPEFAGDMVNSMLSHAEVQGFLPIWTLWGKENYCMIGNHAVPVVVDACLKELPGIDPERAFHRIKKSLTENHYYTDWEIYDKYGYYPFDLIPKESVSRTLECGYDDYCAAQLAKKLNRMDEYDFFMKRAGYYQNLFDPDTGLMRGKDSKGHWREPFDPFLLSHAGTSGGDYTEGNAWQYTWHVMQDVDGLIGLLGGKEAFAAKLDSLFFLEKTAENTGFVSDVTGLIGQYAQGNEPSHHVIYLYSLAGKPRRTAELIRTVFDTFYQPKTDGLCGNDDCGQMSAWYLFSALGFYPVNPVSGEYVLGAPQFPEVTLLLPGNRKLSVIAKNLSKKNKYVKSVQWNGQKITNRTITHKQMMQGGVLVFEMKK